MLGPSDATIRPLFAVFSDNCPYTKCRQPFLENGILVGEICHINGERLSAARCDPPQTDAERNAFDNIFLLYRNCLRDMRRFHEDNKTIDKFGIETL